MTGKLSRYLLLAIAGIFLWGCSSKSTESEPDNFQLLSVSANERALSTEEQNTDIAVDALFEIEFSTSVDTETLQEGIDILNPEQDTTADLTFTFENDDRNVIVDTDYALDWKTEYELTITDDVRSAAGTAISGAVYRFETENGTVKIVSASLNDIDLTSASQVREISFDDIHFEFTFSNALNENEYQKDISFRPSISADYSLSEDGKRVTVVNTEELDYYSHYSLEISNNLTAENEFNFDGYEIDFQTGLDSTQKLSQLTEEELLDKVQRQTFRYFWDFAHPVSGLARERTTSDETVTIGGSGFGLMAIIVGIHRGFISRSEGVQRFQKIVDFLDNADRFHGAWPHWMNGSTGEVIPFSEFDDGGDLVETAFMAQGLITVREFLDSNNSTENELIGDINGLLDTIEWDWYTRDGQDVLYWHWSPNHSWEMNHQIKGYNEALIVYILAASSTDHSIDPEVYHEGWASSGSIQNGGAFYGYTLPLGYDYGGPLFFSHYSFLGLDPRNLSDRYADYWKQNRNHTLINREHSIVNPNNFVGYSADSWGLTASDEPNGYSAHDPANDNGTITPTAAVSSMPYTPEKSIDAVEHFYYILGDKLWGEYGFYDAFNPTEGWWANSYLAIDQGPIIIMIENHRSGLLWDLFMDAPEVQTALDKLDFTQ
jgi:PBP1b-binding outer membrane lipoprotein LpoB